MNMSAYLFALIQIKWFYLRISNTNWIRKLYMKSKYGPETNWSQFYIHLISKKKIYAKGSEYLVPWRCVHAQSVHPFNFFSVSSFLSTRRGPCRSEAPSTARAAPGDHEPLIGGAWWRSMGELRLGRSVTWSFSGWTNRQSTEYFVKEPNIAKQNDNLVSSD